MAEDLFPAMAKVHMPIDCAEQAIAVARKLGADDIKVLVYHPNEAGPWFAFDVGERKFAIWRATGNVYEGDEYGAMGEDPLEIEELT